MGVAVTCPKCHISFAFDCNKCSSYDVEIHKGFEPEKYFSTRAVFYLQCRRCNTEYDHVLCPDCDTQIFPTAPFVKGDAGGEKAKGCFIATACLGDNSNILKQLYLLRDELLEKNKIGKKFVKYYYIVSPPLASCIHKNNLLKSFIKYLIVYPAYYGSHLAMKILSFYKK
jgi:hypothetical protein